MSWLFSRALGWLRYEALRRLQPTGFAELRRLNMTQGKKFDDMVDQMIVTRATLEKAECLAHIPRP